MGSMTDRDDYDLDVDYELDEVDDVLPVSEQKSPKPTREELKRRARKLRSERKNARTAGSRRQTLEQASDAMAGMDPEVLRTTLQGISSQMGIPPSQLSKIMG